jgi:uncharacterized protein YjlB
LDVSGDFLVVGVYPQNSAVYDQPKPEEADHGNAVKDITGIARPKPIRFTVPKAADRP